MMINVDLSVTTFCESGLLIEIIAKLLGKQSYHDLHREIDETERNKIESVLKNIKVSVIHRNTKQHYRISGISPQGAQRTKFEYADGHKIDVASYFQKKYGRLVYPHLPCVIVKKDIFLPIEICEVIEVSKFILFIFFIE